MTLKMPLGKFHLCTDEKSSMSWDHNFPLWLGILKSNRTWKREEKRRDLGEGKGLTLVCWAVSPGELPDVIFWGQAGTAVGAKLGEAAQKRDLQESCWAGDFGDVQP